MIEDPVIIEGKEYKFAEMPAEAQKMVTFIDGIDAQLDATVLQMELAQIGRDGCFARLTRLLAAPQPDKGA